MFRNSKFKKERGKKRKNWEMEYSTDREESRVHVSELAILNVSDYLNLIHRSWFYLAIPRMEPWILACSVQKWRKVQIVT